jgi:hypothetical protein
MAEFITFLEESALKDLQTANLELTKMVANVDKVGQKMQSINTPSGSDGAIKDLAKRYADQEKQLQKVQKELERTRLAEIKLAQDREKAFDKYDAKLAKEQAKLQASQNIYNKVQAKLNALSNEYKNLATKKELNLTLTQKEEQRYTFLQGKIQQYDKTLKAVDATMGKYQRNVGNYASGFNPLSNSINQLTREMPAFTYSVQTGFMALSNNIPIFTDALSNAVAQNKELQAQGKPTTSVLKQLAGAFFGWQTLMGIGITLLTVFGKEIGEWITGSGERKKAIEAEKKALEDKNKAEDQARESIARHQSAEIANAKVLLETAKNVSLSYAERTKAVNELQKRYPDYLGNLSKEKILAGDTAEAELKLNDALVKRGIALASQELIQQSINDKLKNQKWLADQLNQIQQKRLELGAKIAKIDPFTRDEEQRDRYEDLNLQLERLFYLEGTLKEQYQDKNKTIEESIKYYVGQYNANAKYIDTVKESTEEEKKNKKVKSENNKEKEKEAELLKNTEAWFEKEISRLKEIRSKTADTTEEYKSYNAQLAILEDGLRALRGEISEFDGEGLALKLFGDDPAKTFEDWRKGSKEVKELDDSLKQLFQTTANGALTSFGMDSLIPMFDGKFKEMWETADNFNKKFAVGMKYIGDVAKQTFEFINQQQQAQYDQQFQRLEQERDIALLFAGESATAREEIERQYEERRRAIQRKQAESQKKIAIFNSIVNTAQGVTSALAMANIPLAIVIGALGAIQTAMIASQQIPQFYKGTENAPEGWAYTQEKGAEIITDKSGKIKSLGSNKGAELTYLNKGDKVYTAQQSSLMFDNGLNEILTSNGISMPKVDISVDNSLTNAKLDKIAKAIENKDTLLVSRDIRGEKIFKVKNGTRQQMLNTRLKIGKFDV